MREKKVLIFAGTTEGRRLTEYLTEKGVDVHVCVATEYGESLLPDGTNVAVSHQRMDCEHMEAFIREYEPDYIVDATHPYAKEVTANIKTVCKRCDVPRLRLVREAGGFQAGMVRVKDIEEAVRFLERTDGNILVTTGSKELEKYTKLSRFEERIYARVLSVKDAVIKCEELGIKGQHLICMQGPFSVEMNAALLKQYDISYLVTKESGVTGGYPQKCEAAEKAGVSMVVVGRPEEEGYSFEEVLMILKKELNLHDKCKISIVGIGPGSEDYFTVRAKRICRQADIVIGAKRMTEAVKECPVTYVSYKPEEIISYLEKHLQYRNVAVVMSGDTGFYSGAGKLKQQIDSHPDMEAEMIPGVSSVAYLCARIGTSWEDAALVSVHGKKENILSVIRDNRKTIVITGSDEDVREICRSMQKVGYGNLTICIGINLSYAGEQILEGVANAFTDYKGGALAVLYIENPQGGDQAVTHGLPDTAFLRGDVPMTKEEVRSVCLSKLRIQKGSIIYDVGAGTGSVSVEAALQAAQGHVYAIERERKAVELIRANSRAMRVDNLTVIEGAAPEALRNLPAPDCVFIGGSGGHLPEILEAVVEKNPNVRVVISAITLETLAKAVECCKSIRKSEEEIVQLSVAKAKNIGSFHMMIGQNPVFVISFTCDGKGA